MGKALLALVAIASIVMTDSNIRVEGRTLTATPAAPKGGVDSFGPSGVPVVDQGAQEKPKRVIPGSAAPPEIPDSDEKDCWPELVGCVCQEAKSTLEQETTNKSIYIVPAGTAVTLDYRTDRIRLFCDGQGMVVREPRLG